MIIHLHGFGGHGQNTKYEALCQHFGPSRIFSPTLPVSPLAAVALVKDFILAQPEERFVLVGTSLGGFFAYCLHRICELPAHLINPALHPWDTLADMVGTRQRYDTGEVFEWTPTHLQELRTLERLAASKGPTAAGLHFYLGRHDELINHDWVRTAFSQYPQVWTEDSHRFGVESFVTHVIPALRGHEA